MGWETGTELGASAVSGFMGIKNAQAQTSAMAESADYTAANLANKTSRNIGTLETSFLKGGIALNGAGGPAAIFQQAGAQGTTDIQRTIDNANASISNTMNAARSKSLDTIAQGWSKIPPSSITSTVSKVWQGSGLQSAWNGMVGNTDPSPQGTAVLPNGFGSGINWSLNQ